MVDLNVLLDVVQRREPFYAASAEVLSRIMDRDATGYLPGHALTTLYYVTRKSAGKERADQVVDLLLATMEIVPEGKPQFLQARSLAFSDFEDAVVASAAASAGCERIVTRNVADFAGSPIPAVTPEELLVDL
ncbi:MAG TPA: PIN domain-containing protein [Thermoanaerobaculia bacterium]|jgi:predicted nucleic acid-binding protein|nr:PIN domain-containing protein [Thermoanaerobaculia bacterium]